MSEQEWNLFEQPEPLPDPSRSPFAKPTKSTSFDPETFSPEPKPDPVVEAMIEEEEAKQEPEKIIALSADETTLEIVEEKKAETPGEPSQVALFDVGEAWEHHWKDAPAFVQKDLQPFKSIYVHFENRADMEAFGKLVGQKITLDTRAIWHPEADIAHVKNVMFYVDEKPEDPYVQNFED